jgi:Rrf2 family iron-sulfur cluster assembly transcriptional regulator
MSTLFSRQCEYALQAVLYLAAKQKGGMFSIKELASILGVPYHFLAKILQQLAHQGLLRSNKGKWGGFAFAKPANRITLLHIIEAIDGEDFLRDCVLGFPNCSSENPCSLHELWSKSRDSILHALSHKTIDEMAKSMKKDQYLAPLWRIQRDIEAA